MGMFFVSYTCSSASVDYWNTKYQTTGERYGSNNDSNLTRYVVVCVGCTIQSLPQSAKYVPQNRSTRLIRFSDTVIWLANSKPGLHELEDVNELVKALDAVGEKEWFGNMKRQADFHSFYCNCLSMHSLF